MHTFMARHYMLWPTIACTIPTGVGTAPRPFLSVLRGTEAWAEHWRRTCELHAGSKSLFVNAGANGFVCRGSHKYPAHPRTPSNHLSLVAGGDEWCVSDGCVLRTMAGVGYSHTCYIRPHPRLCPGQAAACCTAAPVRLTARSKLGREPTVQASRGTCVQRGACMRRSLLRHEAASRAN
jgi:hypothetical protein